jgi:hypothetical protein
MASHHHLLDHHPRPSIAEFDNDYDFDEDEYVFTPSSDNATSSDDDE